MSSLYERVTAKRNGGQRISLDAVVVGSGPNGLAAAIEIARAGRSVRVYEAADTIGGGLRSAPLTGPGFVHDVCAAIHPLGIGSPFFRSLDLSADGMEWIQPEAPLAHPLDDGGVVMLERSIDATVDGLGADGAAYRRLVSPWVERWPHMASDLLGPIRWPSHPLWMAMFGALALRSATSVFDRRFSGARARALLAGMAAHSFLPLDRAPTAGVALMLTVLGHAVGWPLARGGSQRIADALAARLRALGGEIKTAAPVTTLSALPAARATLLDVTPRQLVGIAGDRLPDRYRSRLDRFRYGPGVFKIDWALDGPVPWTNPACARAATVHIGGSAEEIAAAERTAWSGSVADRPFVLLAQPSLFDASRAPHGHHTVWAYCHVPNGSTIDMTDRIRAQIERFAPGFRDRIVGVHVRDAVAYERYNANCVGGDINGGAMDLRQTLARPVARWDPYRVPGRDLYLCSASTPPGGGAHGMCGVHAARSALRRSLR